MVHFISSTRQGARNDPAKRVLFCFVLQNFIHDTDLYILSKFALGRPYFARKTTAPTVSDLNLSDFASQKLLQFNLRIGRYYSPKKTVKDTLTTANSRAACQIYISQYSI